jgi:hypothetical protein
MVEFDDLTDRERVERVLRGVGGTVVATTTADAATLDGLLGDLSEAYPDADWSVDSLVDSRWTPRLDEFGLVCTVCENTVGEGGVRVDLDDGGRHVVCCSACAADITDRYERLADSA